MKSPPPPLFERGETSLARHFLQLPPFAKGDGGGFSCVDATNIQVMSVYEAIILNPKKATFHLFLFAEVTDKNIGVRSR